MNARRICFKKKKIKQLIRITIAILLVAQNKDKLLLLLKRQLLLLLLLKTKYKPNPGSRPYLRNYTSNTMNATRNSSF